MAAPRIAIVNYQAGNLRSVQKALERFGADAFITSDADEILAAAALLFPGQGANDSSMKALKRRNLVEPIRTFIASDRPFLGVCLGLQLLLESSDEGTEPGFGVVKGRVRRLPEGVKVPHMGWNQLRLRKSHPLLDVVEDGSYFYFVHSYYADPEDDSLVAGTVEYGVEFCAALARDNMLAVQFHPEKSGENGLRIYERFVKHIKAA